MSNILSPAMAPVLRSMARPGTLVVLDFDGTLAPIVGDRTAAKPSSRTLAVLRDVADAFPLAVLSGRGAQDLRLRLDGVAVRWFVGSHGLEWPGEAYQHLAWRQLVAGWRAKLQERLDGVDGVEVESKALSLAIHYRGSHDPHIARTAILEAVSDLPGVEVVHGKRVVNLLPQGAGDKGTALQRLVRLANAERVLFIGDDVTDEAAFCVELGIPSLMVRVGRTRATKATHWLDRRTDLDVLLRRLVEYLQLRSAPAGLALEPGREVGGIDTGSGLAPVLLFMRELWALEQGLNQRSKSMLSRYGVTGPQRLVVRLVGRLGPVSQAELARLLHVHPSSITRLIRTLEHRGFVRRIPHPSQPGRLLVDLGPGGERVERLRAGTVESAIKSALAAASESEIETASRVIRAVTRCLLVKH